MALDTFVVIATVYDAEEDALADFELARSLYADWRIADTYDAAVVSKGADGQVRIVVRHEQPVVQGAVAGLGVGLAVGALIALFPAVGLGVGLALGGPAGAASGALGGHVVAGMSRHDLKELGELLDDGQSGLVVVAAEDVEARVDAALERASRAVKKALRHEERELERLVEEATAQRRSG